MRLQARVKREYRYLRGLLRTLARVRSIATDSSNLICDDLEAAVDKWRERRAITFGERTLSYGEMDAIANRYAHWAQEHGLRRGQTVALFLPNRIEYLSIWYGLSKIGVATALINNNLSGAQLRHCLNASGAVNVIADAETTPIYAAVKETLERAQVLWTLGEAHGAQRDLSKALMSCSPLRPDRSVREGIVARDVALYIYTSGTTGLPKPAKITHMRAQLYMRGFAGATDGRLDDRVYITLPLYHATGGLCGMGAALLNGGSVVLRPRFSVSHFWTDVTSEGCTMFVYIGELCRYLVNQPPSEAEHGHKLRLAFGNGMRPDIWDTVKSRFQLPQILEFYGSTEGNVSMFNYDGKSGAIGRIPRYIRKKFNVRLALFDVEAEAPVRGLDGRCVQAAPGEIGECVGQIGGGAREEFAGYADKAASERKVLHEAFAPGDAWFRTGDLMRQDSEGYFYFVDRIGDTFRWKGENVSTSEVAGALAAVPGVLEATVYGVKVADMDGRAGMVSLVVAPPFDIADLATQVDASLPSYARPIFVRLQPQIEVTGTFKYRKIDLVEQGFDPASIKQPLYFRDPAKGYMKLTKAQHAKVLAGAIRF
jgi:fatty-acyl-CoA synthase